MAPSRESLLLAIRALLKWIESQPKHQKSQLFEADDILYLILTLTRIPSNGRTNPYRIPIPHPIHPFDPQSTSICLILDDRPTSPLLPAAALEQIRNGNLPISSVIGLSDLKSDYRPFESRRKLCDSYDLFFCDRKIIPLLPRLLGNHFFRRKKIPLAVDFSRAGWSEQIKSWCSSSLLYLRTGTCCGLKIGRVTQTEDEILENAVAAIEGAMKHVPKKWANLRSVHVKTVDSLALPVYQAVPGIGLKIESNEGGILVKGKKRARREEKKKAKKGRIHDVGEEEASDKKKMEEDENGGDKLGRETKKRKKERKGLESEMQEDGDGGDVVSNKHEEVNEEEIKNKKDEKDERSVKVKDLKKKKRVEDNVAGDNNGIKKKIKVKRLRDKDGKKSKVRYEID